MVLQVTSMMESFLLLMLRLPVSSEESWLGIAVAFDAVFLAAGLVLFPFVFSGDE